MMILRVLRIPVSDNTLGSGGYQLVMILGYWHYQLVMIRRVQRVLMRADIWGSAELVLIHEILMIPGNDYTWGT